MNKIKNIQKEIGAEYWKEVDSTNFIKLYKLYKATLLDIQGQHRLQNKLKYRDNILVERFAQTVGLLQTEDGSSLCQEWKHGCILGTCWTAVEWNWNLPRSSLQKPAIVTKQLHTQKIHERNQITCTGWLLKWLDCWNQILGTYWPILNAVLDIVEKLNSGVWCFNINELNYPFLQFPLSINEVTCYNNVT